MRHRPPDNSANFYECFSDVLFSTMIVFVFLMMVFLAYFKITVTDSQTALRSEQTTTSRLTKEVQARTVEADEAKRKSALLQQELDRRTVRIIVVVDNTGSMGPVISAINATLSSVGNKLPELTPLVEVGIVAHADSIRVFPLQRIVPKAADTGASSHKLSTWLSQVPSGRKALTVSALHEALDMLDTTPRTESHVFLLVLGDVGAGEEFPSNRSTEESKLFSRVAAWSQISPKHHLLSFYTGQAPQGQDARFFSDLAKSTSKPNNYHANGHHDLMQELIFSIMGIED